MNNIKYAKYFLSLIIIFGMLSCTDFDELNSDPTKSTNMDPNLQIPTIQMRQSENHQEWARYLAYPAGFMNQWTGSWGTIEYGGKGKKYDNYLEQMWISYYPYMIKNVVDVVQRTKDNPQTVNINSVGRILKVQCFLKMTDMYGDIPYFDAGMAYYTGVFKAKYDKQEDIYNDMLKELREASAALNPNGDLISHDLYYNGSIPKWKKFANSLWLRIAMRLVKVDPDKAKAEAEAAIAAGVFESNSDICYIQHENSQNPSEGVGKGNGIATRLFGPEDITGSTYRVSLELITEMVNSKDPRIPYYARCYYNDGARTDITDLVKAQLGGTYEAMALPAQRFTWDVWVNPITISLNGEDVSVDYSLQRLQPSKLITAYGSPYIHMSYAEVAFLKAEAAVRGWNVGGGDAQSHFESGLRAAVEQWSLFGAEGVSANAMNEFISQNTLVAGNEIKQINTQLWVLHILDPVETWSNWRRTGFPELIFHNYYPAENQSNGQIPRRLEYPKEEQLKNTENYNEALERMGGSDDWLTRMWWDVE